MKIAIAGNIASGKTEVEKILIQKGFDVYDTDKMAHEILENSSEIKELFGTCDRKIISDIVFNDKSKLKLLENIIHPKIREQIIDIQSNPAFISIPLLFETKMESLFDKIIFVSAPLQLRLERLMKRNNLTEEDALKRINSQNVEEEKIKKSDFVINNDSTREDLENQILEILSKI